MIKKLFQTIRRFLRGEEGPASVEYAVLLLLVILACITAIQVFGMATANSFQDSSEQMSDAINEGT